MVELYPGLTHCMCKGSQQIPLLKPWKLNPAGSQLAQVTQASCTHQPWIRRQTLQASAAAWKRRRIRGGWLWIQQWGRLNMWWDYSAWAFTWPSQSRQKSRAMWLNHWVLTPQGTCSLGGSMRKQRSALWNLTALCIIYSVLRNGYAWIKSGFQRRVSRDVPRIKNYWCIKAVLDFEVFRSRAPSKPEMGIVMDAFNQHFQAWWTTLINYIHIFYLVSTFLGWMYQSPSQQFAGSCYPSQWLWCDLAPKKGCNSGAWTTRYHKMPQDELMETWYFIQIPGGNWCSTSGAPQRISRKSWRRVLQRSRKCGLGFAGHVGPWGCSNIFTLPVGQQYNMHTLVPVGYIFENEPLFWWVVALLDPHCLSRPFQVCRMWQNSPSSSRSPWGQALKDKMMRAADKPPEDDVDLEAETEILGAGSSPSDESGTDDSSSDIPLHFLGVDEPDFSSNDEARASK